MSSNLSFSTPDVSHLTQKDYEEVYEPAEDTYLLMDALEKDVIALRNMRPTICVEIGSGSGMIITFLAKILDHPAAFIAVDKNPKAAKCTKTTAEQNGVTLDVVTSDLLTPLSHLFQKVDILLFNPPYVVTPSSEVAEAGITSSWAGGISGREVLDRVLPIIPQLLSPHGVFYLITIQENKPDDIQREMKIKGFQSEVVLQRKAGPEHLSVLKFYRTKETHAKPKR